MDRSRRMGSQYEISLEAKELYLLIAGLLLFMILLFIFGVFVGRKMEKTRAGVEMGAPVASVSGAEDQIAEALPPVAQQSDPDAPAEPAPPEGLEGEGTPPGEREKEEEIEFTYYDSLVKGKGVGIQEESEAGPSRAEQGEDLSPARKDSEDVPAAKPAPATLPAVTQDGKFTIQIASFLEREQAQNLVRWLRERGYPAFMVTAEIEGRGTWHRVRVGRFPGKSDAAAYQKELENKIHLRGFITRFE